MAQARRSSGCFSMASAIPTILLRRCLIPLLVASVFSAAVAADDEVFDNRFYVTPMASYAIAPDSRHTDNGYGGRIAVGKSAIPHLGVELLGSYLHYKGEDYSVSNSSLLCQVPLVGGLCPDQEVHSKSQDTANVGAGINAFLSHSNHGLYLHVDAMAGNKFSYDGGLGIMLPFTKNGIGLRAEALYHKENPVKFEPLFNVGLYIPIGKLPEPPAPPAPEPVAVVPAPAPAPPPPPPCQTPAPGEAINLEGCKTGDTIVLRGVNFEFNKATLTVNAKTILDQVVTALTSRVDLKVEVDGHTDSIGSDAYNQKLSERRAASVKAYLVEKGIDAGRLTTKGFGETMPIADNKTKEGRDLNRRVELKVIDSGSSTDVPVSSGATESTAPAAPADSSTPTPTDNASDSAPASASPAPAADSPAPPADGTAPAADAAPAANAP